jgi:hypothetical protein
VLTFVTAKQALSNVGGGKGRLGLTSEPRVTLKGVEVRVTVAVGVERLRSLDVAAERWNPATSKALVVPVGVLTGGATYDLDFSYELAPAKSEALTAAREEVVLRFEAAAAGCKGGAVTEVRLRPEVVVTATAVPTRVPVKATAAPQTSDAKVVEAEAR